MSTASAHPERILLGPGPSNVHPRVLAALARPTLGHLDSAFVEIMNDVCARLRGVFRTSNPLTLPVSGTGSAGMEAVMVNLLEPGDRVVVGVNGVFGGRMAEVAARCGAEVHRLTQPWGRVFAERGILEAAERVKPKVVAVVHAETSTGAHQPVEGLGRALHGMGVLFALDCVTSLAGAPVEIDAWGVDAAYSGTQKCLSCPPGLAPVTFSPRAVEAMEGRRAPVQSWYLDMKLVRQYWGSERVYHHTAPVNMIFALQEALKLVEEEGLEARWARHRASHERLRAGLARMGIRYVSEEGRHLPMLNAVGIPAGIEDAPGRRRLLDEHSIEIGPGLGEFKGRAWRIGLMGHGSTARNVDLALEAIGALAPA